MDWHDALKISGGALALLMYVPLIRGTLRNQGAGQSFAMWALWAVLDSTVTLSLIVQRGNFWLPLGLATGSVTLAFLLLVKGRFAWSWFETGILVLVLACLAIWKFSGPMWATIATTTAIVIAGIPGMVELWRNPQPVLGRIWAGYTIANLLALWGGTSWNIDERFAPGVFAVQTVAFVALAYRPKPARQAGKSPG
jgi:hypothetical protein